MKGAEFMFTKRLFSLILSFYFIMWTWTAALPNEIYNDRADVNSDGIINGIDVTMLLTYSLYGGEPNLKADVTGDGRINADDAKNILSLIQSESLFFSGNDAVIICNNFFYTTLLPYRRTPRVISGFAGNTPQFDSNQLRRPPPDNLIHTIN